CARDQRGSYYSGFEYW
nr:immunoglobulin heavy chain junction region [Macaca mulatta]MOV40327.1 immunoglobulin heavy chain junction region [Macaca mulatta]MOV40582.1 immunoglobulin heavy chain junction region [Macaca mulatta]MOV42033.1 immunoglobulin heavy chain junction region [Macaca mulatta]MOV43586.1 immunoglobulin heavy chain junction region [Macaca mulatta]